MMETQPRAVEASGTGLFDSDLSAWKAAVTAGDRDAIEALAAKFLADSGERWLALSEHVAYDYLTNGSPREAGDIYEQRIQRDPQNTEACYFAFLARLLEGDLESAIVHLSQTLDRPEDLPADKRDVAFGFEKLLLGSSENGAEGAAPAAGYRVWLRRALGWMLPSPSRRTWGDLSLSLWRRWPAVRPEQFRADERWSVVHEEAAEAVKKVRAALARLAARRQCAPGELWFGSMKLAESVRLYSIVRALKPRVVVQCGVFAGFSACLIAEACRANGAGVAHGVDPNIPHSCLMEPLDWARELAEDLGLSGHARFHRGTFATPLWMRGAQAASLPGGEFPPVVGHTLFSEIGPADLVLIDGDHTSPATLADLTLAAANLAEGGAILLHDSKIWPQVRLAVSALLMENRIALSTADGHFGALAYGRRAVRFAELCPDGHDGLGMVTLGPGAP